jgi:hypothetical protein
MRLGAEAGLDMRGEGRVALEAGGLRSGAPPGGVGVRGDRGVVIASVVAIDLPSDGRRFTIEEPGDRSGGLTDLDLDAFGQGQRFAWHAETSTGRGYGGTGIMPDPLHRPVELA